jgi:hypothetical protein
MSEEARQTKRERDRALVELIHGKAEPKAGPTEEQRFIEALFGAKPQHGELIRALHGGPSDPEPTTTDKPQFDGGARGEREPEPPRPEYEIDDDGDGGLTVTPTARRLRGHIIQAWGARGTPLSQVRILCDALDGAPGEEPHRIAARLPAVVPERE